MFQSLDDHGFEEADVGGQRVLIRRTPGPGGTVTHPP